MSSGGVEAAGVGETKRRPPRWWLIASGVIVAVTVVCCLAVVWLMLSHGDLGLLLLTAFALACTGLVWAVWSLVGLIAYRAGWVSLAAPAVVVFTAGLVWSGIPKDLGWWLSESALERAAIACSPADGDRRIGVYEVSTIRAEDNGCLLTVPGYGLIGPAGFAYMPHGEPPAPQHEYDERYRHQEGPWYSFST
ncbi:hypothetical protein ACFXK0_16690 [Nocardia sp. NPDC059177]|uniref:hypothetical protein n=1 Tax=Nocardia sp. NPDC059177 TaxID=3346759 RepID=UPI0036B8ADBB